MDKCQNADLPETVVEYQDDYKNFPYPECLFARVHRAGVVNAREC